MTTEVIGVHFSEDMEYSSEERFCSADILNQINAAFKNEKNILVNLSNL
jgi:hypothetical protein